MSNMYVSKMKKVLENFLQQQREANAEIFSNNSYWAPEYAATENEKVRAKQEQHYIEAQNAIGEIFSHVRQYLANANFPDVERLTDDRLIFESGLSLSPNEIRGFVERYRANFTMLRLIRDYIARQPQTLELATIDISLPSEQLEVYKWFAEEALKILYKIHTNSLVVQQPIEIELFDSEALPSIQSKLAQIGDGHGLYEYSFVKVPESAKHQFDNVLLTPHYVNADIHDRSV